MSRMTLYAVVYAETQKMRDIIPDLVFFDRKKAERAAEDRKFLTGLEEETSNYLVIPLTVRDYPDEMKNQEVVL